ncbi:hypothetical protein [Streptomyces oceani]|uniref:DUF1579 domain-containing protein n=1 Tax=Streptomyces oceani TaxID=1075402 RepID=A0A1E7KQ04_9ACTN|nr:hypothetical protein [Streptomyces oceani]OEV05974.1 hypothetical protein AN216_00880 [Streptomyces oceani]
MTTESTTQRVNEAARPGLRALDVLVGRWRISGEARGETTFAWLPGGFFLERRATISQGDTTHHSREIIGCEKAGTASAAEDVTSRAYTDTGDTLDYTYELTGDTLTIWIGPRGSPAVARAVLSEDRNTLAGAWEWPGGGYEFALTRIVE